MKVAVFSPQPRTSGVVTYSHHVAEGFRQLGHSTDVLTFTLSGKLGASMKAHALDAKGVVRSGWGWSALGADRCERWADATAVLSEYDLVLMEEPRCAPMDKKALRAMGDGDIKEGRRILEDGVLIESEMPRYIFALAEASTRLAVTLHDPWYGPRHAPFLEVFMQEVRPDVIVTHRPGAVESAAWALDVPLIKRELRVPHIPYMASGLRDRRTYGRTVGMTGRYINNKGQPTLLLAAKLDLLPDGWNVNIGGASPLGAGPNHTFLSYEGLVKDGWVGVRSGADVTRGWPWALVKDGERSAEYSGPYEDPLEFLSGIDVHVNGTDPAFSGPGGLEYSTLEAMDAGCAVVLPKSAMPSVQGADGDPAAVTFRIEKLANAELDPVTDERRRTAEAMASAVQVAAAGTEDDCAMSSAVDYNHDVLGRFHSPHLYAQKILEAL